MAIFRHLLSHILLAIALLADQTVLAQNIVIQNVIVVDPVDGPSAAPLDVAVESGKIHSLNPAGSVVSSTDALTINGEGLFLIPGLIDTHTHMSLGVRGYEGELQPEVFLTRLAQFGVTTTLNTGWSIEAMTAYRASAGSSTAPLPKLFAVGQSIGAPNGWGGKMTGGFEISSPDQAREIVARLADADVDAIKIVYDDMSSFGMSGLPMISEDMLIALIDAAHSRGLKAIVHALEKRNAEVALRNGADALVHGVIDEPLDDEFIRLLKKSGAVYVPTHTLFEAHANEPSISHRYDALDMFDRIEPGYLRGLWDRRRQNALNGTKLPVLRENLRRVHEAGISIAMGTDTGVTGVVAGIASQLELVLYAESAMTPLEALASATVSAAALLDADERIGRIAIGYEADLVLLGENPVNDIRAIADIRAVLIDGHIIEIP